MKYEIELGSKFKHSFKRLRKKYHSLDKDLESLVTELVQNPTVGADLGNGVRKVRMAISDKGKGKSHGARVITYTTICFYAIAIASTLTRTPGIVSSASAHAPMVDPEVMTSSIRRMCFPARASLSTTEKISCIFSQRS